MWQKLCSKLRGSVYLIQACAFLHKGLYLRGTQKSKIQNDIEEHYEIPWYIIEQKKPIQKFWSAVIQIVLIYTALYVPFKLAFAAGLEDTEVYMGKVDWIVDFIFIADLFVNFLTSYEKRDGLMEVRIPYIAKNYLRGWFIIDFFACFPVQLIEPIL